MAHQLKVLLADGATPDDEIYTDGIITDVADFEFSYSPDGGILGGLLHLPGGIRDGYRIRLGRFLEYSFADEVRYVGKIIRLSRDIGGSVHEFECQPLWQRLTEIIFDRTVVGVDTDIPTTGTVEEIIEYIFETLIEPADMGISLGDIEASGIAVDEFRFEESQSIQELLAQLVLMAREAGAHYCAGIDQAGAFYFKAVSTLADEIGDWNVIKIQ